jgi:hypothetical protein
MSSDSPSAESGATGEPVLWGARWLRGADAAPALAERVEGLNQPRITLPPQPGGGGYQP